MSVHYLKAEEYRVATGTITPAAVVGTQVNTGLKSVEAVVCSMNGDVSTTTSLPYQVYATIDGGGLITVVQNGRTGGTVVAPRLCSWMAIGR